VRHAANIATSERLQKVLNFLSDYNWHSTFEIMQVTQLCATGSAISELRANGYEIECRWVGLGHYEYKLIGKAVKEFCFMPMPEIQEGK
jgi:hypothetical protein